MKNIIKTIFKTYSEREVKKIRKNYLIKINENEKIISTLSDSDLQCKTGYFKKELDNGKTLEDILPEAFAVVREASKRVLGMRHFDVQLIGGVVLHQGRIAEMKTGEGKTLVATLPVYLNALSGKGVHVITVNDYLAKRDLEIMKPLYDFLGLTSGVITNETPIDEKRDIYKCDIVYITNSELGFDYLRDNMVHAPENRVQREFNYVLIDEVDSILIDEARTPLIISSASEKSTEMYTVVDLFIKSLNNEDIIKDEKLKIVILSKTGVEKAEKIFGLENYSDVEHNTLRHHIKQSLQANFQLKKDTDYIVKNNEVVLIDEFTGRIANGRRYSNGLHQAIEAKEGVPIKQESVTLATVTYQNFFKMYKKLSGMTGTAETEQKEFNEIYGLDVVVVPVNLPIMRNDKSDKLYATEKAKLNGIIEDIKGNHEKGRPVLVGTPSIEKSEQLSELLKAEGIPHQLLNAKKDDLEAEIVSLAGQKDAVTIATNMAGRGTDIKLGEGVANLGGLKVIGSERADNRRIDNQLRGRSGRQGDSGESQFYTSFEDRLMAYITDCNSQKIKDRKSEESEMAPINNKFFDKLIEKCQKNNEGQQFQARKNTTEYDNVINKQREIIYAQRNEILDSTDLTEQIESMIKDVFDYILNTELEDIKNIKETDMKKIINKFEPEFLDESLLSEAEMLECSSKEDLKNYVIDKALNIFDIKKNILDDKFLNLSRKVVLANVDEKWQNHIENLSDLKRDVKLLAYKEINPIDAFTQQSYDLINQMSLDIKSDVVKNLLKLIIDTHSETLIGNNSDF